MKRILNNLSEWSDTCTTHSGFHGASLLRCYIATSSVKTVQRQLHSVDTVADGVSQRGIILLNTTIGPNTMNPIRSITLMKTLTESSSTGSEKESKLVRALFLALDLKCNK